MAITTVTKALRKLYKSVTGEETNKISPTKIISDLADNYSGGGGSSDFSTATLTVVDNITIDLYCNFIDGNILGISPTLSGGDSVKIPIYKDGVTVTIESVDNFSTEGAITSIPNTIGYYLISGDCTVSSAKEPNQQ